MPAVIKKVMVIFEQGISIVFSGMALIKNARCIKASHARNTWFQHTT
jgi:ABC-type Fe3+ transport system substrate-binding protein